MKEITIQYHKLGIKRKISATLPERWSELSAKQFISMAKNHSVEANEMALLSLMLGVKKNIAEKLNAFQLYSIAKELDFLNDFKPQYSFAIRTVKGLYAPRPRLEGMSFGQFMYVDTYFEISVLADDPAQLNKFIGCLYLPDGKQFDEKLIQERANYVCLFFRPEEKTAISLNYRLVKEWLCKQYPLLFQAKEPETNDLNQNPVAEPIEASRGSDWVKVYESLVGDDIVNQDKYAELPLHYVFRYLTTKIKENAKR